MLCLVIAPATAVEAQDTSAATKSVSVSDPATLAEARTLFDAARYDEVIKKLNGAAPPLNAVPEFNYLLGIAYYHKRDYPRAIEALTVVVSQGRMSTSEYRESAQALGLAHYLMGHIKEALPLLEKTKEWAPENTELAYVLGLSYLQTHQPEKARESFARMFRLPPNSAGAHLLTAQMMMRQEFEEFAEQEARQALELDSRIPQAHYLLGELAIFHARPDEGIAEMLKEIELNPGFALAYWRLGDAYTRQLKWDEAIPPLQKAIWLNPYFSGPFIILGKVYLKKKDLSNAEGILRRAAQMDPNNASAHYLLAQVFQQTNRPEEARREFALAEKLQSSSIKPEK